MPSSALRRLIYVLPPEIKIAGEKKVPQVFLRGSAVLTVEKMKEILLGFGCLICSKIGVLAG